jgi:hypothetical protein
VPFVRPVSVALEPTPLKITVPSLVSAGAAPALRTTVTVSSGVGSVHESATLPLPAVATRFVTGSTGACAGVAAVRATGENSPARTTHTA